MISIEYLRVQLPYFTGKKIYKNNLTDKNTDVKIPGSLWEGF